jgi:very-short-patch-repair endonuclease
MTSSLFFNTLLYLNYFLMHELPYQQYNTNLKPYGKKNRKQYSMTKHEWIIWNTTLKKNITGHRFLRQKIIGPFILDFYCSKLMLGIEIDGSSHDNKQEYDATRTEYLTDRWITIIRYTNNEIDQNLEEVIENIKFYIKGKAQPFFTKSPI